MPRELSAVRKWIIGLIVFMTSTLASAFIPAGGIWVIDSENTGQPGRGFQIEVENEVLLLTYYGYRSDGSSVFYIAAGAITGNTFSADLMEFAGGAHLGANYRPAVGRGTAGRVTMTFVNGTRGTITLPGETPKSMSKLSFGYGNGPDGLLGTWLFTMKIASTSFAEEKTLIRKLGATAYGNGAVSNAANDFVCEFHTNGYFQGKVLCMEMWKAESSTDRYSFTFSGDRGNGVDAFGSSYTEYPSHVLRVATANGRATTLGLTSQTPDDSKAMSEDLRPADTMIAEIRAAKVLEDSHSRASDTRRPLAAADTGARAAFSAWAAEVRVISAQ